MSVTCTSSMRFVSSKMSSSHPRWCHVVGRGKAHGAVVNEHRVSPRADAKTLLHQVQVNTDCLRVIPDQAPSPQNPRFLCFQRRNSGTSSDITFVKSALPSASNKILPSAPTDFPHASITKASLTATHAIVSTPFSCNSSTLCQTEVYCIACCTGTMQAAIIRPSARLPSPQSLASASGYMLA